MDPPGQEWRRDCIQFASEQAPWLAFVGFYAIFVNLPFWIVEHEFGFTSRGWFCVEYAAVGLIALTVPRVLAAISLFAIMIADLLCGICLTFHLPVRECVANLSVAYAFTRPRLFCTIVVGLLVLLAAAVATLLPGETLPKNKRWRAAVCLAAFAAIIVCADSWSIRLRTGHLPILGLSIPLQDGINPGMSNVPRFVRIPIIGLMRFEENETRINTFSKSGPASAFTIRSATDVAVRGGGIVPGGSNRELPNIVLVLVESWGLTDDAPLNAALVEPYLQPKMTAKYEVIQGIVPFHGPTISGEARELCDSGIGFHLLTAPASDLRSCLPARLAALSYRTIGVHGMSGHMFNRSVWCRTIGFQEGWFYEQFKRQGLPDCTGAFIGTCDADIAAWIGRRLEKDESRPIFIHWMTLNSHLPVPVPTDLPNGTPCSPDLGLKPDSPLCSWYQLIANVLRSVAQQAIGPLGRPTAFVIVGDHAPPFGDPAQSDRFSQSDVPYVVLLPILSTTSPNR